MAKQLTKAELLARIEQCEREAAAHIAKLEEQQRELDAMHVAQRPSRARSSQDFQPTVATRLVIERRGQCTVKRWIAN